MNEKRVLPMRKILYKNSLFTSTEIVLSANTKPLMTQFSEKKRLLFQFLSKNANG